MNNLNSKLSKPSAMVSTKSNFQAICRLGGITAILTVLTAFIEVVVTFLPGGSVVPQTVIEWYMLLQGNWFMGLRNLGLLNIIMFSLGILMYFALYVVHSSVDKERAAVALIIILIGTTIFFSTNRAFAMLELSHQYIQAGTESQKIVIEAAGKAMLAVGRSHSPGTFIGFAFGELAGITMSIVMLRNKIFGKKNALVGIIGFTSLLIFECWSLFTSNITGIPMIFALLGAVLNITWLMLLGLRFFKLARNV
ncbi:MAG: conserved rane protein of unknown function [Clostridia bacterium]|jgi:hypothetical protein|nr:conserved rane protein of unknown function [Clostridia bacterium]